MKLNEELSGGSYRIRAYQPGRLTVNDRVLESSVVIAAETLHVDWPPTAVEEIDAEHLQVILELEPEVVLLGTGERQRFPERTLLRELLTRGIGVEVMDTAAAARTYNVLMAEERRVVAGLLLR